ncbi:MAG TPA: helix-turn-helix transcriptional regulator [Holophaga sp.]|nr:helix-turn-helix transcriptional regulator [Holophaga sp.]
MSSPGEASPEGVEPSVTPCRFGALLREARQAQGISPEALAEELSLSQGLLEAIEADHWDQVPPGRERPMARMIARRLMVDLSQCAEIFSAIPGDLANPAPDPRQESMERLLTIAIAVASLLVLAWLVVPRRNLREGVKQNVVNIGALAPAPMGLPKAFTGPFPVLGEVLPEAPITAEGILVNLRAMDACEAHIVGEGADLHHSMRVSEPWCLRVKGPFTLSLDNAGVVNVEVAGQHINHGRAVSEAWSGTFDTDGQLQLPEPKPIDASAKAPDAEPDAEPQPSEE